MSAMDGATEIGTVAFTQMKDGSRDDYLLLRRTEHRHLAGTADRLLRELARQGEESFEGYQITRLDHALQSATRAVREGADVDWIVSALLHDIGDGLAPQNHDRFAAEILRPFVRDECVWVVEHHGAFQMIYYAHHYEGWNPNERDRYRGHPYFDSCAAFCERWDQASFDPAYDMMSLTDFEPLVREVFTRRPYDAAIIRLGEVIGLPAVSASS
jgi:predicted HD phosphohydrolase